MEIDHRISSSTAAFANFWKPIVADRQLAIGVLPSKGPLHFLAESRELSIKPTEHPSKHDRHFGGATVWRDHGLHVVGFDDVLIVLGVKSGIQREGRATQVNADVMSEVH